MGDGTSIGENIRNARKAAKLTQREVAAAIGKSYSLIQKYEANISVPPINVLVDIARVLNTDYVALIGFNDYNDFPLNTLYDLSDEEFALFSKIQSLDKPILDLIKYIVDMFYEYPGE